MNTAKQIVTRLLEMDDPSAEADEFLDRHIYPARPQKIELWGKRWNSRASGYHRCHIYVDDKLVHVTGLEYGSSDQYIQTGLEWLVRNNYLPEPDGKWRHPSTTWLRDHLKIPYMLNATDVKRERDTL